MESMESIQMHVGIVRSDYMDKNVLLKVKEYLKVNRIADIDGEKSKMQLRAEGKHFSTAEHMQGMIYSLLSAQTVWANI